MQEKHSVLIVGANSHIAKACYYKLIQENPNITLHLMAKNTEALNSVSADIKTKYGVQVFSYEFDAENFEKTHDTLKEILSKDLNIQEAYVFHGVLSVDQSDYKKIEKFIAINSSSAALILEQVAPYFENQKKGSICLVGSVAGDRGKASNYLYGASKAYLETLAEGLQVRLARCGVNLLLVKPGFVITPMTEEFKKGFLWVSADKVAGDILKSKRKRKLVLYTPWIWFWIMFIIKSIPRKIYLKLKL